MKLIALLPVYNETSTLDAVMESLASQVDYLVIVDDGSDDSSLEVALRWASGHNRTAVLQMPENRGMSAALREGFIYAASRLRSGELGPDDLLFTLDADGQHDPGQIRALSHHVVSKGLDVALTRRNLSLYPVYKRFGNWLMTVWGRVWSGHPYHDVESGFRAMRLKAIPPLLEYYTGHRYSCAQEIAVLTARLGFRVDNRFQSVIQLYRSQTSLRDAVINASFGLWAFLRWALRRKVAERPAIARLVTPTDPIS
jgi:glycosyltransferase involved in cell wall biosynthesis